MSREDYKVSIREWWKELSTKERINVKQFADCTQIEDCEGVVIFPVNLITLDVHNEHTKSGQPDYTKYVIIDKDGTKYITGSETFINALDEIYEEIGDDTEEWGIKVIKRESKNYSGKHFLSCAIV